MYEKEFKIDSKSDHMMVVLLTKNKTMQFYKNQILMNCSMDLESSRKKIMNYFRCDDVI